MSGNGRQTATERFARGVAFSGSAFNSPVLVSSGARVWRLRNWYMIDRRLPDTDSFAWGYRGQGPYMLAYSMLRELFGAKTAERHGEELMAEVVATLARPDGPMCIRGGYLWELMEKTKRKGSGA
ncbi:MAG: hypothetical protein M1158_02670 [Candidatus Marsarchaeota archaeon]|nr:hypothetical protein [Candidatus Marsarchaeota archaeon]